MSRVNIAAELSIYQVAELKPLLQQALDQSHRDQQPIELGMQEVTELDGAGLQLLLALCKSANEFGVAVHLHDASAAVWETLHKYGLANRFASPISQAPQAGMEVGHGK